MQSTTLSSLNGYSLCVEIFINVCLWHLFSFLLSLCLVLFLSSFCCPMPGAEWWHLYPWASAEVAMGAWVLGLFQHWAEDIPCGDGSFSHSGIHPCCCTVVFSTPRDNGHAVSPEQAGCSHCRKLCGCSQTTSLVGEGPFPLGRRCANLLLLAKLGCRSCWDILTGNRNMGHNMEGCAAFC